MPNYELGPIRPVAEAESLILRVTRGCPWNRCAFCTSYKSKNISFSMRTVEEVKSDVLTARSLYKEHEFKTCFLQDGDIFCYSTEDLISILSFIKEIFPEIRDISCYGIAHKISKKSAEEIQSIADAGLTRVYCGMESGSDKVLKLIRKGSTSEILIRAGRNLMNAGVELSYFLIMGAGGMTLWEESALESARVLNEVKPDYIRVRSLRIKPESELMEMYERGEFVPSSEEYMIREQQLMLENLYVESFYDNDHSMNLLMNLRGDLPEKKAYLLDSIQEYLDLEDASKRIFHYGVRTGRMRSLSDLNRPAVVAAVEKVIPVLESHFPDWSDVDILNYLRVMMTSS